MSKPIKLNFLKSGLLTLVVDDSKIGYQKFGVPVGGAMDSESAKIANWLVGNKEKSPLLEINMVGPQIEFADSCQVAITGANISPIVNDNLIEMHKTQLVEKGSIIKFGELKNGCRAYLAIGGEWKINNWIKPDSSINTSTISSLNSIDITAPNHFIQNRESPKKTFSQGVKLIRVSKGSEFDWLKQDAKEKLFKTVFYLLPPSNRMGYRLTPNLPEIGSSIISSGVVPGTLQITQDGNPILLMKDAPATGGYVRALNVISDDMAQLGQLQSGGALKFILIE